MTRAADPVAPPRLSRVGPEAAGLVSALHERCLGEAWSIDSIARLLALPGSFAVVADDPDAIGHGAGRGLGGGVEPAGFILCLAAGSAVDIAALGVVPERRRRGLGAALVEVALTAARAAGAEALMLEVAADNDAARRLYERCGFALVARRPRYYRGVDGRRDALVLRRPTRPGPGPGPNLPGDGE